MTLQPHSKAWYDRLATMQEGYFYPWRSRLDAWHGEDVFRKMVFEHLRSDMDVLEIACAQGELALAMAPHCHSVLGYDRIPGWIEIARKAAARRGIPNITFVHHDSSTEANDGRARLPAADHSIDLFVCSKGPFHWIEDTPRVGRPGAVLLMLVPDVTPLEPWTGLLPDTLRWEAWSPDWARPAIEGRLDSARLRLHSWWCFDVPEQFPDPEALYTWRAWGFTPQEVPTYQEVAPVFERIFKEYAGPQGLEIRRRRYIWKAVIPEDS